MATLDIATDSSVGYLSSSDTVSYANARAGSGSVSASQSTLLHAGQDVLTSPTTWVCYQSCCAFDTSTIPGAVVDAALVFVADFQIFDVNPVLEARLQDWGATVDAADFIAGANLGSATLLATYDIANGWVDGTAYTMVNSGTALKDNINASGFTRVNFSTNRQRLNNTPTLNVGEHARFRNSGGDVTKLRVVYKLASVDEILNPDIDALINSWVTDTGGTVALYAAIDEDTASDSDYIQSPVGPTSSQYYETSLQTHADPLSSSGHIVHYRYRKNVSGGAVDLTVSLRQGSTPSTVQYVPTVDASLSFGLGLAGGVQQAGGTFVWGGGGIASVAVKIQKVGSPSDGVLLSIYATSSGLPTGSALGTAPELLGSSITDGNAYTFTFSESVFVASGTYAFVLSRSGSFNSSNYYGLKYEAAAGNPDGGAVKYSGLSPSWQTSTGDPYFVATGTSEIVSWSHTNISNTWTTQNQTLSSGRADSIFDYNDLRLRFTPSMTTSDVVPTFVAERASANSNSTVTTVDLVLSSLTVGNYLIIRAAADNSGGGGAARSFTPSNQSGTAMGTHTEYQQNCDPGAASAGTTLNVSVIKIAATSGTIRLTYSGSVVQACVAEEWSGIDGTTPVVGTPVQVNGTNSTNLVADSALTEASVANGNVVMAFAAVEGPSSDTYTQDSDTTNGSWSSFNTAKLGTSNATATDNQTIYGAYKAVTATGGQTYNPTINNARDSAGIILELAAAAPTIRAQVSWANLELPSTVHTSSPPLPFARRTFRTLVTR